MNYYGVRTVSTESIRKEAGIEGNLDFGQKSISTLERNLLNPDELLRMSSLLLIVIIRGEKALILEKMIYTEHKLANKLRDVSVNSYKPNWNTIKEEKVNPKKESEIIKEKESEEFEEITFDNF